MRLILFLLLGLIRAGYGRSSCLPVVQIMSDLVAVSAFRELGHDRRRMLVAVAVLALRHSLVLFLMAECACKSAVLCL